MFFRYNIPSENIVLAINKYIQNKIRIVKTIKKKFLVSSFVGQTTCFNSLKESLKNCIIVNNK